MAGDLSFIHLRRTGEFAMTPTIAQWTATVQVSRVQLDFIETVTYRLGHFYSSGRVVTGPPGPEVQLTTAQMQALLTQLNAQREQTPPGTDAKALQAFIDVLSDALSG
jgi:hypothetical protein